MMTTELYIYIKMDCNIKQEETYELLTILSRAINKHTHDFTIVWLFGCLVVWLFGYWLLVVVVTV